MIVSNETKLTKLLGSFEKTADRLTNLSAALATEASDTHAEASLLRTMGNEKAYDAERAIRAAAKIRALVE
jgi:hypothetical protein